MSADWLVCCAVKQVPSDKELGDLILSLLCFFSLAAVEMVAAGFYAPAAHSRLSTLIHGNANSIS